MNHRHNFTFRLPNSPEIEYADEQQLYSQSGEPGGLVDISYLDTMREQLPNLAGFPDSFILRTPMQTLLKMESNAMKRSSIDRARNVEDKLTFNMDLISQAPSWRRRPARMTGTRICTPAGSCLRRSARPRSSGCMPGRC